jgi:hypothetical protein
MILPGNTRETDHDFDEWPRYEACLARGGEASESGASRQEIGLPGSVLMDVRVINYYGNLLSVFHALKMVGGDCPNVPKPRSFRM